MTYFYAWLRSDLWSVFIWLEEHTSKVMVLVVTCMLLVWQLHDKTVQLLYLNLFYVLKPFICYFWFFFFVTIYHWWLFYNLLFGHCGLSIWCFLFWYINGVILLLLFVKEMLSASMVPYNLFLEPITFPMPIAHFRFLIIQVKQRDKNILVDKGCRLPFHQEGNRFFKSTSSLKVDIPHFSLHLDFELDS